MEEREPRTDDELVLPDESASELEDLTPSEEAAEDVRGGVRKAGKGQQEF